MDAPPKTPNPVHDGSRSPRDLLGLRWGIGHAPAETPLSPPPPRAPEITSAWLHAVSGPAPDAIARGAFELAARFLAGGDRVLLIDAGPRLALHRRFGRESRWGVVECLTGTMPVLGLVQDTGRLGLYLLAHGTPARHVHWPQLGRLAEEARPHFGRAIVALETDAPAAIGTALAGWHLEGWWAGGSAPDRKRDGITGRLGIHLHALDLDGMAQATLEHLDLRLWTLAAGAAPDPEPAAVAPPEASALPQPLPAEPEVVGCDQQVSERLRFLLWARRLQTGDERASIREGSSLATR